MGLDLKMFFKGTENENQEIFIKEKVFYAAGGRPTDGCIFRGYCSCLCGSNHSKYFTPNTTTKASEVNANFQALVNGMAGAKTAGPSSTINLTSRYPAGSQSAHIVNNYTLSW